MPDSNGKQTNGDMAHRIGIWVSVLAIGGYVLNLGMWVGAADEKFSDAEAVENKQDTLILDVNTLATEQKNTTKAVEDLKEQSKEDKKEILAAIKEMKE